MGSLLPMSHASPESCLRVLMRTISDSQQARRERRQAITAHNTVEGTCSVEDLPSLERGCFQVTRYSQCSSCRERERERVLYPIEPTFWLMCEALASGSGPGDESNQASKRSAVKKTGCGSTGTRAESLETSRAQRGCYRQQKGHTATRARQHESTTHPKATEQYSQFKLAQKQWKSHSRLHKSS